jgi:hypothetical protein
MLETLVYPVGNGAVVIETGEHVQDLGLDFPQSANVEEGLLLSCKGSVRQVFRRGRGTHRHRGPAAGHFTQLAPGLVDGGFQFGLERRLADPSPDLGTGLRKGVDVVCVQLFEPGSDPLIQT